MWTRTTSFIIPYSVYHVVYPCFRMMWIRNNGTAVYETEKGVQRKRRKTRSLIELRGDRMVIFLFSRVNATQQAYSWKNFRLQKRKKHLAPNHGRELRNPSWQFLSRVEVILSFEKIKKKKKEKERKRRKEENSMKRKAYLSGVVRNFDRYTPVMRRVEKL